MYDNRFQYREHISWTNLRSAKYKGAHSGDITSTPNGACEVIDLWMMRSAPEADQRVAVPAIAS